MQNLFDAIDVPWRVVQKIQVKHGVTPEEVEEAVLDDRANQALRAKVGRYIVYGRTLAGRKLVVVLADAGNRMGRCVTARSATTTEGGRWYGPDP